jgi:hypothetical protein
VFRTEEQARVSIPIVGVEHALDYMFPEVVSRKATIKVLMLGEVSRHALLWQSKSW